MQAIVEQHNRSGFWCSDPIKNAVWGGIGLPVEGVTTPVNPMAAGEHRSPPRGKIVMAVRRPEQAYPLARRLGNGSMAANVVDEHGPTRPLPRLWV